MILLSSLALATTLSGDSMALSWNSTGTLADTVDAAGIGVLHGESWVEWVYAGTAWQAWMVEYEADGEERGAYAISSLGSTAFVTGSEELDEVGRLGMRWSYATTELNIEKTESFAVDGRSVAVTFVLRNDSARTVDLQRLLYGLDPDPEVISTGSYNTRHDVLDLDEDGTEDFTQAVAPSLLYTVGLGGCTSSDYLLGSWSDWQYSTDADVPLIDGDGAESDSALGALWWPEGSLPPGRAAAFTLVLAFGDTAIEAQAEFVLERDRACCDQDLDGEAAEACGGADCDDLDPTVAPGQVDVPYDGVDADCAGNDDGDQDGDGQAAVEAGGSDCDDTDPAVNGSAEEIWHDGIDQNCDGNDDDKDQDGFSWAADCDDENARIHEGCPEGVDTGVVDAGSCGCTSGAPGAGAALTIGALLLAGRRRRA